MAVMQKPELNKDSKERDMILFGKELDWVDGNVPGGETFCGHSRFEKLSLEKLKELRDKCFLYLDDQQNNAPTIEQFIEFMEKFPDVTAHGYAISPRRDDYRISIEGLEYTGRCGKAMQLEFTKLCRKADVFTATDSHIYCWFD